MRMNVSHCLSPPRPGFNSQPWRSISNVFLVDHTMATQHVGAVGVGNHVRSSFSQWALRTTGT